LPDLLAGFLTTGTCQRFVECIFSLLFMHGNRFSLLNCSLRARSIAWKRTEGSAIEE
jgi:hypothetical protein